MAIFHWKWRSNLLIPESVRGRTPLLVFSWLQEMIRSIIDSRRKSITSLPRMAVCWRSLTVMASYPSGDSIRMIRFPVDGRSTSPLTSINFLCWSHSPVPGRVSEVGRIVRYCFVQCSRMAASWSRPRTRRTARCFRRRSREISRRATWMAESRWFHTEGRQPRDVDSPSSNSRRKVRASRRTLRVASVRS